MSTTRDFDTWGAAVARELVVLGVSTMDAKHVAYENEDWFRRGHEGGDTASMAAYERANNAAD